MTTFRLIVSSPDGNLFDGDTEMLTLRGSEGDLAIMAGHVPFITSVAAGNCRITLPDGTVREGIASGGLLTVSNSDVTLLSGDFHWK